MKMTLPTYCLLRANHSSQPQGLMTLVVFMLFFCDGGTLVPLKETVGFFKTLFQRVGRLPAEMFLGPVDVKNTARQFTRARRRISCRFRCLFKLREFLVK